ncbi:MAG: ABC transporter substrate-binding protein [Gammaproteobacteria bacterium]|nr:ABC transporter substrate-binding protein [Gammaproteobacteria bacterium]MDD9884476.1 ABC transporter substrate-binding protein [Gammaproteobacteria bacterium]
MSTSKTARRIGALASAAASAALGAVFLALPFGAAQAQVDEVTVAYFLEWPTPNQVAQLEKTYDDELGVKVNWKSFSSGNDMSAAMASGDVHISYSQGLIPFIVATSRGLPIRTVGIAVAYAEADNCVVHNDSALDRTSAASIAASLRGKKIATPEGNVTHYKLLKTLAFYGLSARDVNITPMAGGQDAAAAFLTGRVDIGCAFGGPLDKMKEQGQVIMTGAEQENVGIFTFDVISVTDEFAKQAPGLLTKFMQVTEDANKAFADNPNRYWGTLAKASGMTEDGVRGYLGAAGTFSFPSKDAQLGDAWMGGNVQAFTKSAADFFVDAGVMPRALGSYDGVYDTSFLKRVK